jgi:hypothetical protein
MLTQERLRNLFDYDAESGELIWKNRPRSDFTTGRSFSVFNSMRVGVVAGNIDCLDGYRKIGIDGRLYRAHRLVWMHVYGSWPAGEIDHINQLKSDNRIANLRSVSRRENERNKPKRRDNTSGTVGVYRRGASWRAIINADGTSYRLGTFRTLEEAIAARRAAEQSLGFHANHGAG